MEPDSDPLVRVPPSKAAQSDGSSPSPSQGDDAAPTRELVGTIEILNVHESTSEREPGYDFESRSLEETRPQSLADVEESLDFESDTGDDAPSDPHSPPATSVVVDDADPSHNHNDEHSRRGLIDDVASSEELSSPHLTQEDDDENDAPPPGRLLAVIGFTLVYEATSELDFWRYARSQLSEGGQTALENHLPFDLGPRDLDASHTTSTPRSPEDEDDDDGDHVYQSFPQSINDNEDDNDPLLSLQAEQRKDEEATELDSDVSSTPHRS